MQLDRPLQGGSWKPQPFVDGLDVQLRLVAVWGVVRRNQRPLQVLKLRISRLNADENRISAGGPRYEGMFAVPSSDKNTLSEKGSWMKPVG